MLFRTEKRTIQLLKLLQNNMMSYYQRHSPPWKLMLGFDESSFRGLRGLSQCLGGYVSKRCFGPVALASAGLLIWSRIWMAAAYRLGDNFLLKLEVSTTPGGFPGFFCWSFPVLSLFKIGDCQFFHIFFRVGISSPKIRWLIHPDVERSGGKCVLRPEKVTSVRRKEVNSEKWAVFKHLMTFQYTDWFIGILNIGL